jgi:uncharacterized membrane protein YjjB (DUF3815 family)
VSAALLSGLEHGLWAGAAAACFAVLFNVPVRALLACGFTGLLGHVSRSLFVVSGLMGTVPASLLAATAVSLLGVAFGRRLRAPAVIFVIPGIIPLVPGALAFRTIVDVVSLLEAGPEAQQVAITAAAVSAIRTTLIGAALATGVAFPSLLLRRNRLMRPGRARSFQVSDSGG